MMCTLLEEVSVIMLTSGCNSSPNPQFGSDLVFHVMVRVIQYLSFCFHFVFWGGWRLVVVLSLEWVQNCYTPNIHSLSINTNIFQHILYLHSSYYMIFCCVFTVILQF